MTLCCDTAQENDISVFSNANLVVPNEIFVHRQSRCLVFDKTLEFQQYFA